MPTGEHLYTLLHEDESMVVVNKAPHALTLPDRFRPDAVENVYHFLKAAYGEIFVVHRIDKETSGTLCFARNEYAHRHLSMQFERRQVRKFYRVLTQGVPEPPEGSIEAAMMDHPTLKGKMVVNRSGKPALSHYKVIEAFRGFAWVEVQPVTGRMHQIRVHMAHIGTPPAVDALYNQERKGLYLSEIKRRGFHLGKWAEEEQPLLARVPLHAERLELTHPQTEQPLTLESPLPKDLRAVLQQLRKWDARS